MNEYMLGLIGLAIGFGLTFFLKSILDRQKQRTADIKSEQIITEARHQADALIKEASLEAKDRLIKMKSEFDAETKETRSELKRQERRIIKKEENIDRKIEQQEQREKEISGKEKSLRKKSEKIERQEREYEELVNEQKQQLERIPTLTAEQAKELLPCTLPHALPGHRCSPWRMRPATMGPSSSSGLKTRPRRKPIKRPKRSWRPPFNAMPPITLQNGPSPWFSYRATR